MLLYIKFQDKLSKAPILKGRVDVFVDDSIKNFEDLNSQGIPCLLIDSPQNRNYETEYRIHSLDEKEIESIYLKMKSNETK